MALVLNDRVKETTTSTGTGTVNLAGAETGFETFVAGIGNTNTTYYAIVHQSAAEFEVGIGTVSDSSPDTLSRTTILSSSNSDSAVNFSAGTKDVFCTLPASKAVFADASGNVGIGLTSPASKLHIRAGTNNNLEIQETGGDLRLLAINDARAANVPMEFAASQFDFLTGAVTVGDTAVANLKIGNSGDVIQLTAKKDGTDDIDIAFLTQASGGSAGEGMRITSGGDVAIGTTTVDPLSLSFTGTGLALNEDSGTAFMQIDGGNGSRIDFGIGGSRNTTLYADANGAELSRTTNHPIHFKTNNTERMRIANDGNVGIGTSSPLSELHVSDAGDCGIMLQSTNCTNDKEIFQIIAGANASSECDLVIRTRVNAGTGGTEHMRITQTGNIGIGESSPDNLLHVNSGSANVAAKFESTDSIAAIQFTDSGGSAEIGCSGTSNTFYPNGALKMSLDSSGNLVASGNITAYGSPSDIKLKENIEVIDNALNKVKQLKGITYDLKSDGNRLTGLIAQDLEKVLPEAVYTAKDLEDEEHLAIRYGNTVGLLVEAIKELEARVKELEGK